MLSALISTRIQKQIISDKLRGDVLLVKTEDSVFSALEHAQGFVVQWQDDLLEALLSELPSESPIVHPYAVYETDENGNSFMVSRSAKYVDVELMPNAADILDPDVFVPRAPWADIASYVKERE